MDLRGIVSLGQAFTPLNEKEKTRSAAVSVTKLVHYGHYQNWSRLNAPHSLLRESEAIDVCCRFCYSISK